MILIFLILSIQSPKVECDWVMNFDCTTLSNSHIAITTECNELYIFDLSLNLVKKIDLDDYTRVFSFKDFIAVITPNPKTDSLLIDNELNIKSFGSFAPRWISGDGNAIVYYPGYSFNPILENGEQEPFWDKNTKNLQRFDYIDGSILLRGERFLRITPAQYRSNLNWKGFWIFEKQNNSLDIITQKDPYIFNDRDDNSRPIEIPNFIYRTDLAPLTDQILTWSEYYHSLIDSLTDSSIILGVYRYYCGFVICYADHTAQKVTFSRLAYYDENWNRYGEVQVIPGKLIGVHNEKGYMLTFPDEDWVSELSIIELTP